MSSTVSLVLTGKHLTLEDLVNVARDDEGNINIVVEKEGKNKVEAARKKLEEMVVAGKTVYGSTTMTGPGLSYTKLPNDNSAYISLAAGYATRWGEGVTTYPPGVCRAAWTILCNSFANGTSAVSLDLVNELSLWINHGWNKHEDLLSSLPLVEKSTSIGYGDINVPAELLFGTLCQRSLSRQKDGRFEFKSGEVLEKDGRFEFKSGEVLEKDGRFEFKSGEVLAMISTNCFTLAEATMCFKDFEKMLKLCEVMTALDMEAEMATTDIISVAAERVAQWEEKKQVICRIRGLLKGSSLWTTEPSAINPFVTLRASPDLLGTAWSSLNSAKKVLTELINAHQGNPVVAGPWLQNQTDDQVPLKHHIGPVCHFDSTRLFCSLSSVQQAMGCLALSVGLRGEHLIKTTGQQIPSLLTRRMHILEEAATRDCVMAASVVSPALGRMGQAAGYDWAAPAPLASSKLVDMVGAINRLFAAHCAISCQVIFHKMSSSRQLGEGVRQLYRDINQRSFQHLQDQQPFSFQKIIQCLEKYKSQN